MALQQNIVIDKIEILENGIIQIRQRTDIFDDLNPSIIMASNYHRNCLTPGQDLTGQEPKVLPVAHAIWTPAINAAYQTQIASNIP